MPIHCETGFFDVVLWEKDTRAVIRLVWPSILLQYARDRVATAAETVTASRLLWIVHLCLAERWRHLSDFDCIAVCALWWIERVNDGRTIN